MPEEDWTSTYYIRDAQGEPMAIYRRSYDHVSGNTYRDHLFLDELPLYGSARLGVRSDGQQVTNTFTATHINGTATASGETEQPFGARTYAINPVFPDPDGTSPYTCLRGMKHYELTDHLGNVRSVVSDIKIADAAGGFHWKADIASYSDYDPFGSLLPGRNYSSDSYAHGFNGMRKDDEIHGVTGSVYTTLFRENDTRIGNWWSLDPKARKMPWQSPYVSMDRNPILYIDPLGDEVPVTGDKKDQKQFLKQVKSATGGKYKIEDGTLVAKRGKYGQGEAADQFKAAIEAERAIPINLVNNSPEAFFDDYGNTNVDVGDYANADQGFIKATFAHFMAERLASTNYGSASQRRLDVFGATTMAPSLLNPDKLVPVKTAPVWDALHFAGLVSESLALAQHYGKASLPVRDDAMLTMPGPDGLKIVHGWLFSYGSQASFTINLDPVLMTPDTRPEAPLLQRVISVVAP